MSKKYVVALSDAQRAELRLLIRKGTASARVFARARVLLLTDEGRTGDHTAANVHMGTTTVERLRRRYVEDGLDAAVQERLRPGGTPKLDGKRKACSLPWRAVSRRRTAHTPTGRNILARHIPAALGPYVYTKPCLYTLIPDRDFVIDTR